MLGRRGGGKIRCGRMAVSSLAHAAGRSITQLVSMIKRNADSSVAMRLMCFSQCTTVKERQWVNDGAPGERRQTDKKGVRDSFSIAGWGK